MNHRKKIIGFLVLSFFSLALSAQFLIVTTSSTNVSCYNGSDGTGEVTSVTGGVPPYTYQWHNNDLTPIVDSTSSTISGLTAGNYFVRVYDVDSSSTGQGSISILPGPNIAILIFKTDVTCNGADDGQIMISAVGGNPPFEYSITNGSTYQSSPIFSGLSPGSYNVMVKDSKECTKVYGLNPVVINEPGVLTVILDSKTDIDCYGTDNGAIYVTTSGGSIPYIFSWEGPGSFTAATEDITLLGPGDYDLEVEDANECVTSLGPIAIIEAAQIVISSVTPADETCHNAGDGTISVMASGGTGTLHYTLTPGPINNTDGDFTGLSANTYNLSITDDNGCGPAVQNIIIVENPDLISITSEDTTSITCNGADDGTITVVGQGGTGTLHYTLNPGAIETNTTGVFTGIAPGANYSVSVTDDNTCPAANSSSWDFTQPAPIVIDATTLTDVTCNGLGDGSIDVDASGGTGTLTYSITPAVLPDNNDGVFVGLSGGTYSVSVTDSRACGPTIINNLTITDPPPLAISSADSTHVTCNGNGDGSITVVATGGTGTRTYSITPGVLPDNSTGVFSPLDGGNYSVSVTDDNGCGPVNTGNINIINPALISIASEDTTSITCNGANDGTITVVAQGGTGTLHYTLNPGAIESNTTGVFTGIAPGANYSVSVTDDNSCPAANSSSWDFAEPNSIAITDTTLTDVTCNGFNDGEITVTASGGTGTLVYTLTPGPVVNTTGVFSSLGPDTYAVSVTDQNNCTPDTRTNLVISEPDPVVLIPLSKQNVSCNGANDGSITVTATGGSGDLTFSILPAVLPDNTTGIFSPLSGGLYTISVTDNQGCPSPPSGNFNLSEPDPITIDSEDTTGISCNGAGDARIDITASGGTGVLTYILKNPADVDTNTTGLFTGLSPATYTVDVNDENDCGPVTSNPFTFTEPGPIDVTVDPTSGKALACYGDSTGSLDITVTGGRAPFTYAWTGPNAYASTSKNIIGLKAGDYNLTVADAKGCSRIYTPLDSITEPPEFLMSITSKNISCFGATDDTVWVNASGGTPPYMYDDGFGPYASNVFVNLGPGTHTLEVIDANTCSISDTVTIVMPQKLDIVGENVVDSLQKCNGDSNGVIVITATGGTGVLEYSIDSGYTFTPGNTFTGLGGGTYYSAVRDQNGCIVYKSSLLISNPPVLYINKYSQDDILTCFNAAEGEVRIKAAGGTPIPGLNPYIYVIDLADTALDGRFPNLNAGNHDIDIYDANGCTTDTSIVILSPPPITISIVITHVTTCYEDSAGTIAIIASGGTGLTKGYIFQGDTTFIADTVFYDSLPVGNYDFTIIDSLGCEVDTSAVINSPDSIAYDSVIVLPVTCFGDTDGEIRVYGSGGTPPYTYILNPGADTSTTGMYTNLAPGDYTVNIGDSQDCKPCTTPLLTILEPPPLVFDSSATTTISCNGMNDGVIAIYASGGLAPYTYSVDTGASFDTAGVVAGLAPGTYIIVVQDSSGCSVTGDTITLADPPALSLDPSSVTDVSTCFGDSTGAISVSATGGTGALEYSLDSLNWQASGTFSSLPAGIYTAVVRDFRSCMSAFPPDTIGEPPPISATITTTTAMIPDSGSISISASGGTPPLEYSIDSGTTFTANTFYLVVSDIYGVVIRDARLCTYEESVTVTATPPLEVSVSSTSIDCYNNNNGSIVLAHLNGIGTMTYSIDGGTSPQSSGDFNDLAGGMYYIHVADSHRIYRDTVNIINPPPFDVTGTITPATCSRNSFDGTILLSVSGATPPYSYLWSNDSTCKDISGLEERNYWVNITDQNACQYTENYSVTATVNLRADAGEDTTVCYGDEVTLNGSGGDEFTWSPEEGLSRIDIANPVATVTDSVSYILFTRDQASGCSDRDTVTLTVHPYRGISAGQDTTVAPGQTITLSATGGIFASYQWQPEDGLDNPSGQSTTATISTDITYAVTGTTEFGCSESDSMNISVATGLHIYSGFTPNGDGVNDFWDIDYIIYYPNATVKVFDRWGKVVFASVGYADNQRWDGKYKSKDLPIGTYYYIIDLKDGSEPHKGPVTIVR